MRNRFNHQLNELTDLLIEMGELCEAAITKAALALESGDKDTAREVILSDAIIDQLERDIEHLCLRLLLHQQPVARDLRHVSAALKLITDLERIGDQAADIAEIVKSADTSLARGFPQITEMAKKTAVMVTEAINAYVERDLQLAGKVQASDDGVDRLFMESREELIRFIVHADETDAQKAVDLIMIAKYLERIGDHATNVAEWVSYAITGVHDGELDTKPA